MWHRICLWLGMLLCGSSFARVSQAQFLLQQPIVQQFGVQTSVIVPNGGFLFLGGVSRAAHSRYSPGIFGPGVVGPGFFGPVGPCGCRGSSYGFDYQATSLSVGVSIVDLAEIDRQVLAEADELIRSEPEFGGRPGGALRFFAGPPIRPAVPPARIVAPPGPREPSAAEVQKKLNNPEHSIKLGQEAEAAGQFGVAKLHYQQAQRLGSLEAPTRLAELPHAVPKRMAR